MTKIFLAGIFHETHSVTDDRTGLDDFLIHRGQALLDRIGDGSQIDGFLTTAAREGWEVVAAANYLCGASGMVEHAVFETFWDEIKPVLVAALATRTIRPGSALLLFGLAPLVVLVLPGLGLGIALLKRRSLTEQLLQAAPLSIGGLLVVVMWLDLLGVRNSLELMAVCGLTLIGMGFLSGGRDR